MIDLGKALAKFDRLPIVGRSGPRADYSLWAGGIFGVRIQVGFDVEIELFPRCPWHCQKVLFFEGLAAIVGNDLTKNEQAKALAILIETLNN